MRISAVASGLPALSGCRTYSSPTVSDTIPLVSVIPYPVPSSARGKLAWIACSRLRGKAWPPEPKTDQERVDKGRGAGVPKQPPNEGGPARRGGPPFLPHNSPPRRHF